MPADLTTVTAITKEIYEGSLRKQLNQEVVALRRIEKTSEGVTSEVGGKYVTFPIHTRRNQGIGARREMELLPTAGKQGTAAARVGLKYLYGAVQLSGQVMSLVKTNAQSFISTLDLEVNGLKDDLVKDVNRQVYGDGTGTIGVAAAGTSVNTIAVDTVQYFQDGMIVDIITGTTLTNADPTVKASARTITAINEGAKTVTFDGAAVTFVAGDVFVRTGNVKREPNGFKSLIGTQTLFNIDPANEPVWKSNILANGGTPRALSEDLMISAVNEARKKGGYPTVGFYNLDQQKAYFNLLKQERRYPNTTEFEGGFKGLAFMTDKGDIPLVVDTDAPTNQIQFIDEKNIKLYHESDWGWMDKDGSMWERVPGYDAYRAMYFKYCEMGIHRRNTSARLSDLS